MQWSEFITTHHVTCSNCGHTILKQQPYIREAVYGKGGWAYYNMCVKCSTVEMKERVEFFKAKLKQIKIYTKVKEKSND